MAWGLIWPSLRALDLGAHLLVALLTALLVMLIMSVLASSKRMALIGTATLIVGFVAVGLVTMGRNGLFSVMRDTILALYLKFSGQNSALPMYALPCTVLVAVLLTFLSFILCQQSAGFYSALMICMVIITVLWVTGRHDLMLYCLPSVAALIMVYAGSVHEEIPMRRIMPLALILVVLAFLVTPPNGVVSPAMEKTANDIRQAVSDYLFFNNPRNKFSLLADGYYPNGVDQLGGVAEPKNRPVMQVQTPTTVYLRGTVKDQYTGHAWYDTTGSKRYLYGSVRFASLRDSLQNKALPTGSLAQSTVMQPQGVTVKMASQSATTLFVPQRIRDLDMLTSGMVPYFNNASEVFITRDLEKGDTYRVSAPLIKAGDAGVGTVIEACLEVDDPESSGLYSRFTALPEHLEQQLFDLSYKITEQYTAPYDKALALQNYLSRYYRYTLEPKPMEGNVDFVTHFLLVGKEGYCTYFASAMTVLCRMQGLPARYVEGYVARPNADGTAYVTGLDAHAWTEVYFDGFGWLTFDATPPREDGNGGGEGDNLTPPTPEPSEEPDQNEATPPPDEQPPDDPEPDPESNQDPPPEGEQEQPKEEDADAQGDEPDKDNSKWWIWLIALAVIGAVALRVWLVIPLNAAKRQKTVKGAYDVWIQAIFDAIHTTDIKKLPGETLIAYAERLDNAHALPHGVTPVMQVLSHLTYSKHDVEKEYVAFAQDTYTRIYGGMKKMQKAKLLGYRVITPSKKAYYAKRI